MFKRKLDEIFSGLYRNLVFPFKRMKIENKTGSIMKQGSYLFKGAKLVGHNYIGKKTILENTEVGFGSYVNNGGLLIDTTVGKYTSIGADVKTILGSHPIDNHVALHPAFYSTAGALGYSYAKQDSYEEFSYIDKDKHIQVCIGNDVWIGNDVRILGGVTIADGCIIGAGSLVNKDTESYGVYAGVPAKLIKKRFDDDTIAALNKQKWWDKDEDWIKSHIDDFNDVSAFINLN